MTIADAIPDFQKRDIKILSTDIDSNVVARGKAGEYSVEEIASIPEKLRSKYLSPVDADGKRFVFDDNVRRLITFKPLNLLHDWPMKGPFDDIFMRNVIIYFNNDTQEKVLKKMWGLLTDKSYLYIAHSENISRVTDIFVGGGRTIYQRNSAQSNQERVAR